MLETAGKFDFIAFDWERDPGGYRLATTRHYNFFGEIISGRAIAPAARTYPKGTKVIEGRTGELVTYAPKASDAPHRQFAELPDDTQKLVAFANRYGLPAHAAGPVAIPELRAMRDRLKAIIAALDSAAKAKGETAIKRRIQAANVYARFGIPLMAVAFDVDSTEDGAVSLALKARPATLFDYMLLLAALELEGKAEWRRCAVCKELFPIGHGNLRTDKKTCSPKCKKARQRQNKELGHASQG